MTSEDVTNPPAPPTQTGGTVDSSPGHSRDRGERPALIVETPAPVPETEPAPELEIEDTTDTTDTTEQAASDEIDLGEQVEGDEADPDEEIAPEANQQPVPNKFVKKLTQQASEDRKKIEAMTTEITEVKTLLQQLAAQGQAPAPPAEPAEPAEGDGQASEAGDESIPDNKPETLAKLAELRQKLADGDEYDTLDRDSAIELLDTIESLADKVQKAQSLTAAEQRAAERQTYFASESTEHGVDAAKLWAEAEAETVAIFGTEIPQGTPVHAKASEHARNLYAAKKTAATTNNGAGGEEEHLNESDPPASPVAPKPPKGPAKSPRQSTEGTTTKPLGAIAVAANGSSNRQRGPRPPLIIEGD